MKSKSLKLIAIAMTAGSLMASAAGLQKTLTINTSKKGAEIPKTMYGLFFEDINFGADGGLYAEKSRTALSNSIILFRDGRLPVKSK